MRAWGAFRGRAIGLLVETADRVRRRGRSAALRALRLSGAATASYVVATLLSDNPRPVLAPLTALLVVQLTLYSILRSSVRRVISVVAGVLLAVAVGSVVGLSWWSLGALIAVSIVIGQLLRLGDHLLEVPISAMLVLAVGGGSGAASGRIVETVIGAGVGLLVNVGFPPAVQARSAGAAVESFAAELARLLDAAGTDLVDGLTEDDASRWLEDARRLTREAPRIGRSLTEARESRRLNIRALGTRDAASSMSGGFDALEHSAVAVRSLMRSLLDGARSEHGPRGEDAEELRGVVAGLLHDLAGAVRSFGRLVRAEAEPDPAREEAEAAASLETLSEARVRATELLLLDPRHDLALWELNSSLLATLERVLQELDLRRHIGLREQLPAESAAGRLGGHAAQRVRTTTRQLVDSPRRRVDGSRG